MTLVIDASVAIKWVLPEDGADRANDLRTSNEDLIAPDLIVAEISSAVWKRVMKGEFSPNQGIEAIKLATGLLTRLIPSTELVDLTLAIAFQFRHPVYDCFYLALATVENATIATADKRLAAIALSAKIKTDQI